MLHDLRFTLRTWRRNPGFALASMMVLALGLGGSTAIFSALDRVLFRELPYANPGALVSVGLVAPLDANEFLLTSDYTQLWRETPAPFESVTTIAAGAAICDLMEEQPERLRCQAVEHNLLDVLGVRVILGRDFEPADELPGAPRVALIRHSLWQRRFGGNPNAIGKSINLDGRSVPIAGVLPAAFELPNLGAAEILVPQQLAPADPQRPSPAGFLRAFARLKPGIDTRQAHAALEPLFAAMINNVPVGFRKEVSLRVRTLRDRQMGDAKRIAWLLLAGAGALLLIACVNIVNLLLARMAARQREFALRAALGAGKSRLARLALSESIALALAGGALGVALAHGLLRIIVSMRPDAIPKIEQASIDARIVAISLAVSLAAGVLIGLWPALFAFKTPLGFRTSGTATPRIRFALVSAQIALTVAMLGSASLLLRSLWNYAGQMLGFESDRVVTASIALNPAKYPSREQQQAFFQQLLERSSRIPGVESAALSDSLPPGGPVQAMIYSNLEVEGRPRPAEGTGGMVPWRSVTPGYFATLRIPVIGGRSFSEEDTRAVEPAMILSQTLAAKLFPGEPAIGKRIKPGRGNQPWHLVVGISKNVRDLGSAADESLEYYVARRQTPADARRASFLIARTGANPETAIAILRREIAEIDPQLPVSFQTMEDRVSAASGARRFTAWLLAAFAAFALLLAAAGLAGVASYLVTQRSRDLGIRMALGARPSDVARNVLGEAARWVAAGAVMGLLLAWAGSRLVQAQFFGVTAADPISWGVSLMVLSLVVLISVLGPALRASRIDPSAALRLE